MKHISNLLKILRLIRISTFIADLMTATGFYVMASKTATDTFKDSSGRLF